MLDMSKIPLDFSKREYLAAKYGEPYVFKYDGDYRFDFTGFGGDFIMPYSMPGRSHRGFYMGASRSKHCNFHPASSAFVKGINSEFMFDVGDRVYWEDYIVKKKEQKDERCVRPFVIIDEQAWYGHFYLSNAGTFDGRFKLRYKFSHFVLGLIRRFKFVKVINTYPNKKIVIEVSEHDSENDEVFTLIESTESTEEA